MKEDVELKMKTNKILRKIQSQILFIIIWILSTVTIYSITLTDFYDAISDNNLETVRKYFTNHKVNLNKVIKKSSCEGISPLQCADTIEMMNLLIRNGASIHKKVGQYTALEYFATKKDSGEIAFIFLKKGAKPTPLALYNALWYENTGLAYKFLDMGVNPNYNKDVSGTSPIILAAQNGYSIQLIKKLVEAGADVKYASREEKFSVLHTFPSKRSIAHQGHVGDPNELNISTKEILEKVNYFLDKGAKIEQRNIQGYTPFLAAAASNEEVAFLLVEKGAKINVRTRKKLTALELAASAGFSKLTKYLLKKGAKVNAKDRSGRTAIFYAAESGNYEVIKALIDNGANCKLSDRKRTTPLHLISIWPTARSHYDYLNAHEEDFYKGLKLILSRSKKFIHKRNRYNETPWFNLMGWMYPLPEKIKLFLKYGANKKVRDRKTRKTLKQTLQRKLNEKSYMNESAKKFYKQSIKLLK